MIWFLPFVMDILVMWTCLFWWLHITRYREDKTDVLILIPLLQLTMMLAYRITHDWRVW